LEEVEAAGAQLAADGRIQVRELREQEVLIQKRLDALTHFSDGATWARERDQWRASERDRLEQGLKAIEEKLAATSELVALTVRERDASLTDIARNLPSKVVLVDFVQYRRTDFTGGDNQWKEQRYAAYLTLPLARESTNLVVERVDLGEAAPINEAVEFICKRMSSGVGYKRDDVTAALQRLGDLVYAPLARHLTNVSHLIVCPDGQLSRVPFEMLRVGGRFLIEEKTVSYVTSGREIVRLQSRSGVSPDPNLPGAATNAAGQAGRLSYVGPALVMGGPDFDLDLSKAGSASFQLAGSAGIPARSSADAKQDALPLAGRMPALRSLSRDYRGIKFPSLPGAEAEAHSVAKLLGGDCVLRVGPDAREAELKVAVSPCVLHLATHGFFLSDQEFRRTNSLPFGWPGEWGQAGRRSYVQNDWENPLVRCGIALASTTQA
jgi:CHAT domain-containing protein